MDTLTDLANAALSRIGEQAIVDIDDVTSENARVCKQFIADSIRHVLRLGRWNCATQRATLTAISPAPYAEKISYQLPSDFARLLEVNGEQWQASDKFFEIEGKTLVTYRDSVWIRYIFDIQVYQFDQLLADTVAAYLAFQVVARLTANAQQQQTMYQLYKSTWLEAAKVDAVETNSREGSQVERIVNGSRLVRSRGNWSYGRASDVYRIFGN